MALDETASGYSAPVSALRFEPRVDLQSRNFGEAQGDISIRGGIFEGTAIQIAGLTIFDPQTGHYAAELPIPASMLGTTEVVTGLDHAFGAMNATAGTVAYSWAPIRNGGVLAGAFGSGSLVRQEAHVARILVNRGEDGLRIAAEGNVARSQADGTIRDGDHDFFRVAGRIELSTGRSRTQLFAGYQSKFLGWPNLYTPFGVAETEDLETTLVIVSHRLELQEAAIEAATFFRRNKDDYEFDRYRPGLFNPFRHETRVTGGFLQWQRPVGAWRIDLRAEGAAEQIESTSLVAGRFNSRTYWKLSGLAARSWVTSSDAEWGVRWGASLDDTNREGSAVSPLAEVSWTRRGRAGTPTLRGYAQVSRATRVPGYTALNSASTAGLFRGNADLGREKATNAEVGLQLRSRTWSLHAAVFERRDDPLVDWTFARGAPNARSARAVAIDTWGVELVASGTWERLRVVAGYSWLEKDADYFGAPVDASFYALNFPRHRVTLAITAELGAGFEIRSDNEVRWQQPNLLRTVGGDRALLGSLGVYLIPPALPSLEVSVVADNLWKDDFQELPAVPSPGRQVTAGVAWRW